MRTTSISLESLEQFLRLEREYQRLAVGLLHYKTHLEAMNKLLEDVNKTAQYLNDHKDTPWWNSLTIEQRKEVEKNGNWRSRT